ncbi:hypothetical protein HETIRDRAFT_168722 [Heterobasidion irregulare TC 32-1]|uniref:Uncharacterized protein n=1 Tax=Heterobasidion irregulare (strain TC 32-1) TaxID=747525 RepID=W4KI65_HETIT|nr:uncharacterized protein HETIRDRAFT_168722 [Heterobasidion irregulare TC 32-1]ETW85010.1 hypothetical protein HETIRDRAFT_168722 [Heterobasidion irregulare TC 32-1]
MTPRRPAYLLSARPQVAPFSSVYYGHWAVGTVIPPPCCCGLPRSPVVHAAHLLACLLTCMYTV